MANPAGPPLDEIQWSSPFIAAGMQGIHSNSVLFYFAESPFFDRQSNNAVITNQAMFNPALLRNLSTREAFEGELDKMTGLEFRVLHAPADMVTGTGVWVIVKQMRQKNPERNRIETKPLAYYFVCNENIYQAPTLGDILSSKIVGRRELPPRQGTNADWRTGNDSRLDAQSFARSRQRTKVDALLGPRLYATHDQPLQEQGRRGSQHANARRRQRLQWGRKVHKQQEGNRGRRAGQARRGIFRNPHAPRRGLL
ncbi:mediator of rna polymerase ii transcription subunit 6 [Colletotrichum asianum]